MRVIKFCLIAAVLLIGAAVFGWFQSCTGRLQQCYASYRSVMSGTDQITAERQRVIYAGFTASVSSVAFPIPLGDGTNGIILIDRDSKRARLISENEYTYWSPRFSEDGARIVFGRHRQTGSKEQELISCTVAGWDCVTVLRTANSLLSPVDIGNGDIIFASSPPVIGHNNAVRYSHNDLYIVRRGTQPRRLTELLLYQLSSISVGGNKIYFDAYDLRNVRTGNCGPGGCAPNEDSSQIFSLDFDAASRTVVNPPKPLTPLFIMEGISIRPEISPNGQRITFKNTQHRGHYRYNMMIATAKGVVEKEYPVEGFALSGGVFVGDSILFNELFDNHYRITCVYGSMRYAETFTVNHSIEYLKTLERIPLKIDPLAVTL